jgi:hypothetical protein
MEIAIPLLALGGMYVISNQENSTNEIQRKQKQENFVNMGKPKPSQYLPNTNIPPDNYPVMNNDQLLDNVQEYQGTNIATNKYFNQNVYQLAEQMNTPVGNNIQDIYSLSGDYVSKTDFIHNNMVPFTGSKPKGQVYNNNNSQTILDNYSGTGSQVSKKIEQAPLFKPQENVQWTNGAPNMSEFYQSRVNPALKNNMVKPFESIQVGPGLNQGYSDKGSGGFNSGMESRDQWMPKTVDQLRVATNPKEEYSLLNHQGPANAMIKNVGIEGKVEKNRPDRFYINTQDRWFTTTGAEKGTRPIAKEVFKTSNRNELTQFQHGTPSSSLKTASYVPKKYEPSKKTQLEGYQVGHSCGSKQAPLHEYDGHLKSHVNYENTRTINEQPSTFGSGFSSAIGAVVAPLMDMLKPSRKDEYCDNIRIYGNYGGSVPKNYVVDEGDIPNTTIKETTLHQTNGYVGNQTENAAYLITTQQPIANQRDTTTVFSQYNPAGTKYGARPYDAVQTNNLVKETLVASRINQGNAKMFNPNVNISTSKIDDDRNNNRLWVPSSMGVPVGPSMQTHGHLTTNSQFVNNDVDCNRISGDLLSAFKENPYTHSLHSVA